MIASLARKLRQLEDIILVSSLMFVISVAVLQIVLRILFDTGVVWVDSFLRVSVLWLAMIGGMYAARSKSHISIDLGQRFLSEKNRVRVQMVIYFCTSLICWLVAWHSLNLVRMEYQDGEKAFSGVPVWLTESILPFGFSIIALRYLFSAWLAFRPVK